MAAHGAEVLALTGKVRREARLSLTQEIGDAIRRVVNSTVINSTVIASAAKQSRAASRGPGLLFAARLLAMTANNVIHVPKFYFWPSPKHQPAFS